MTLNRAKLGRAVTFTKYLASEVSLIFNFNLEKNHVPDIKVAESCRTGGK